MTDKKANLFAAADCPFTEVPRRGEIAHARPEGKLLTAILAMTFSIYEC